MLQFESVALKCDVCKVRTSPRYENETEAVDLCRRDGWYVRADAHVCVECRRSIVSDHKAVTALREAARDAFQRITGQKQTSDRASVLADISALEKAARALSDELEEIPF